MASNAFAGVGTEFNRWNKTTTKWEHIAEVNSITGPGMKRTTIDVTSLDSAGGYREFIAGFRDAGTVTLKMNFTRVTYNVMIADFESNILQNYNIILPDTEVTSFEFEGLVTELPLSIPADDKVTVDVTIQISGPVVFDSGSGS
jgi:predicted secreted protein